ncbi:MAG: nucleotidyltransferase domain-containing protein [Nanoarchaeota archaeon]|nr:nucleotidyltransferase domain-containing protein [Nanoarchaeota archaeon]
MLQKRNDFEIVEVLRKEPCHLRKIAEKLNLIPSTTMRILKKLRKENIVDYKTEGKNNKYFLKNSPEAEIALVMAEQYKLTKIIQEPKLRRIIKELKEKTKGELIILFGSHAKNKAKKTSDIDIYIETQNKNLKKELEQIDSKLSIKIGKFDKENLLAKEIIKDHVIIQNTERYYQLIK